MFLRCISRLGRRSRHVSLFLQEYCLSLEFTHRHPPHPNSERLQLHLRRVALSYQPANLSNQQKGLHDPSKVSDFSRLRMSSKTADPTQCSEKTSCAVARLRFFVEKMLFKQLPSTVNHFFGTILRQFIRKSLAFSDIYSGISGDSPENTILYIAATKSFYSGFDYGAFDDDFSWFGA